MAIIDDVRIKQNFGPDGYTFEVLSEEEANPLEIDQHPVEFWNNYIKELKKLEPVSINLEYVAGDIKDLNAVWRKLHGHKFGYSPDQCKIEPSDVQIGIQYIPG